MDTAWAHASEIAAAVSDGRVSATAVVRAALARIAKHDRVLNAFTAVTEERALAKAAALDAERARGRRLGALAGVPSTSPGCRRLPARRSIATARRPSGTAR